MFFDINNGTARLLLGGMAMGMLWGRALVRDYGLWVALIVGIICLTLWCLWQDHKTIKQIDRILKKRVKS